MQIVIPAGILTQLENLQNYPYEHNGNILLDENGVARELEYQKGQNMAECSSNCVLNFHTHPSDFRNLYPEHPSKQDFKYIFAASCKTQEISAHAVCTPSYLYVISYSECPSWIRAIFVKTKVNLKIDSLFDELDSRFDRSSEEFRLEWMEGAETLGFRVLRFERGEPVEFTVDPPAADSYQLWLLLALVVFFVVKKNLR